MKSRGLTMKTSPTAAVLAALLALLLGTSALGCVAYHGSARDASQQHLALEVGWNRLDKVELVHQKGAKDCGAAALSTVLRYWEPAPSKAFDRDSIDKALRRSPEEGLVASDLRDYARHGGFAAYVIDGTFTDLTHEIDLGRPVIVGVLKPLSSGKALAHYEVLIGYNPVQQQVLTLDPAHGLRQNDQKAFVGEWQSAGRVTLVVMPPEKTSLATSAP